MKHACESQHGHMNAVLIMTSLQLEFSCIQSLVVTRIAEKTCMERIRKSESSICLTLVNVAGSG